MDYGRQLYSHWVRLNRPPLAELVRLTPDQVLMLAHEGRPPTRKLSPRQAEAAARGEFVL